MSPDSRVASLSSTANAGFDGLDSEGFESVGAAASLPAAGGAGGVDGDSAFFAPSAVSDASARAAAPVAIETAAHANTTPQAHAQDFLWAKQLGGTASDVAYSVALDSSNNVYTVGLFQGTADFDPGPGTFNLTTAGYDDAFVSKLDGAGNFVWARQLGGTVMDRANGVALDSSSNVYSNSKI